MSFIIIIIIIVVVVVVGITFCCCSFYIFIKRYTGIIKINLKKTKQNIIKINKQPLGYVYVSRLYKYLDKSEYNMA